MAIALIKKALYGSGFAIILATAYFGWPNDLLIPIALTLFILGYRIGNKE